MIGLFASYNNNNSFSQKKNIIIIIYQMINMRINRDCMQLDIHFHQAAMEIIEIEEVRSLDFPVRGHRSVLQAPLRRKKTKKSKRQYVFILLLLVTKNRSLIMGKYITIKE